MSEIKIDYPDCKIVGLNHDHAIFNGRNLSGIDFIGVSLIDASFVNCDLRGAYFRNANLSGALFVNSNLRMCDFRGAILSNADFTSASISDAIFDENEEIRKGIVLQEPMVGYKKCYVKQRYSPFTTIVELEIPAGAIVFSINNKKCRTNRATVKRIYNASRAYSMFGHFTYYAGDEINIKNFNLEYNRECAPGIHFFRSLTEAIDYKMQ